MRIVDYFRTSKNIFYKSYIVVASVFLVLDSAQLLLYPLFFAGLLTGLESIVRSQMSEHLQDMSIALVFLVLLVNCGIRLWSVLGIISGSKSFFVVGVASCIYTTAMVVLVLRSNALWESCAMALLAAMLVLGKRRKT